MSTARTRGAARAGEDDDEFGCRDAGTTHRRMSRQSVDPPGLYDQPHRSGERGRRPTTRWALHGWMRPRASSTAKLGSRYIDADQRGGWTPRWRGRSATAPLATAAWNLYTQHPSKPRMRDVTKQEYLAAGPRGSTRSRPGRQRCRARRRSRRQYRRGRAPRRSAMKEFLRERVRRLVMDGSRIAIDDHAGPALDGRRAEADCRMVKVGRSPRRAFGRTGLFIPWRGAAAHPRAGASTGGR